MSKSGLTPYQDELLEILVEECGEIVQEKSKIFRFGMNEQSWHVIGNTHAQCLEQELGDLICMINMVVESDMGVTAEGIAAAVLRKREKVPDWMSYKKPEPIVPGSIEDVMSKAHALAHSQLNNYKTLTKEKK